MYSVGDRIVCKYNRGNVDLRNLHGAVAVVNNAGDETIYAIQFDTGECPNLEELYWLLAADLETELPV